MRLHGLTVCVNYSEFLRVGLSRWLAGLDSLTVVTAPGDVETIRLCAEFGADVFVTELFYKDGAAFNKGRAMEAARIQTWAGLKPGWRLFFDSDVVPPADWATRLDGMIQPGSLYGCLRFDAALGALEDRGQPNCAYDVPGVGYFQLYHSADPVVQATPLLDEHWVHAGNYDNRFMDLWRKSGKRIQCVPYRVAHIGPREQWFGRGNRAAFDAMKQERVFRAGKWDHERIQVQP